MDHGCKQFFIITLGVACGVIIAVVLISVAVYNPFLFGEIIGLLLVLVIAAGALFALGLIIRAIWHWAGTWDRKYKQELAEWEARQEHIRRKKEE